MTFHGLTRTWVCYDSVCLEIRIAGIVWWNLSYQI